MTNELSARAPFLSIVMPAFNEASGIEHVVETTQQVLNTLRSNGNIASGEIVIANDGSTDDTAAILDRLIEENPGLVVVHRGANGGLGAAVRSAIDASQGDLVFYTDADLPTDLSVLPFAIEALMADDRTVFVGRRDSRAGEGPIRLLYSNVWNSLVRTIFRLPVTDVNFAAKLIDGPTLRSLSFTSSGSFFDVELICRLIPHTDRFVEQEITYRPRSTGISTLSSFPVVVGMLKDLVSQRKELLALCRSPHNMDR